MPAAKPKTELEKELLREQIAEARANRKFISVQTEATRVEKAKSQHELERAIKSALDVDAGSCRNRIYTFYGDVNSHTASDCISQLSLWSRRDPGCDITVVFTSPGGHVVDGLGLYDFLRELSANGHHITTKALGYSASMAGVLMQAGDHRVISPRAFFHLHEVQAETWGGTSERDEQEKFIKRLQNILLDILATKSHFSVTQIRNKWKKKDVWFSAEEALAAGFVDEIAKG